MRSCLYLFLLISSFALLLILRGIPIAASEPTKTLTILETSDLHGNLMPWDYYGDRSAEWGLAKVATLIEDERAKDPNLLLLDNGDTIQGTPLVDYYNHIDTQSLHPMAATLNALRFDSVTLGNHEFDYGLEVLWRWIDQLRCPVLAANIRKTEGTAAYTPYLIKNVDGVKVGILGLTIAAVPNWVPPENIQGLRFDDPIATARQYIPKMRAEGADVIVVAQHTGWSKVPLQSHQPEAWLDDPHKWEDTGSLWHENVTIELAEQVEGIDLILAAHSHFDVPKAMVNKVAIAEPSYWGKAISKYTVTVQRQGKGWQVVATDAENLSVEGIEPNPELVRLVQPYHQQTLSYINQPIGRSTGEFSGGMRARLTDSPLGDLINQVQAEAAAEAGYPVDVSLAAIFSDTGKIPQGEVTLRDAYSVYPYDNRLCVLEMTGEMLRQGLELNGAYFRQVEADRLPQTPRGAIAPNARDYNWDLYTGIDYTLDLTRPVGERVTRLQFQGEDLQGDRVLRVVLNSYRGQGGGGYTLFKEGRVLWRSSQSVRDLLAEYIQQQGTIEPTAMATPNFKLFPDLYAYYFGRRVRDRLSY